MNNLKDKIKPISFILILLGIVTMRLVETIEYGLILFILGIAGLGYSMFNDQINLPREVKK